MKPCFKIMHFIFALGLVTSGCNVFADTNCPDSKHKVTVKNIVSAYSLKVTSDLDAKTVNIKPGQYDTSCWTNNITLTIKNTNGNSGTTFDEGSQKTCHDCTVADQEAPTCSNC